MHLDKPSMNRNRQSLCHCSLRHVWVDERIYILVQIGCICHVGILGTLPALTNGNLSHWRWKPAAACSRQQRQRRLLVLVLLSWVIRQWTRRRNQSGVTCSVVDAYCSVRSVEYCEDRGKLQENWKTLRGSLLADAKRHYLQDDRRQDAISQRTNRRSCR